MDLKRRVSICILSMLLIITFMPSAAFAADENVSGETIEVVEQIELPGDRVSGGNLDEPDELLEDYLYQHAKPLKKQNAKRKAASPRYKQLDTQDAIVYSAFMEMAEKVAAGEQSSATFSVPISDLLDGKLSYTAEELGVDTILIENDGEYSISPDAISALGSLIQVDLDKVLDVILADCPYELYWYDKSKGTGYGISKGVSANFTSIYFREGASLDFISYVSADYSATGQEETTDVDTSKTAAASAAAGNVRSIVSEFSAGSDYEKLVNYRERINALTAYNDDALYNDPPYGDPWQLIYVFDGDTSTNVVCEGYSKAFKFLCDLSSFHSSYVACYLVSGTMSGGTGAGPHMWNIVTMNDGKNYLVDVTNCDTGTIGSPDKLFLRGCEDGTSSGYTIPIPGRSSMTYSYDSDTVSIYSETERTLSGSDYVVGTPDKPEPVTAVTLTASPEGSAVYGNDVTFTAEATGGVGTLSYAFYCDDILIHSGEGPSITWTPDAGTYQIHAVVTDSEDPDNVVSSNTMEYTVEKAENPAIMPQSSYTVPTTVKTLSNDILADAEGWEFAESDIGTHLAQGESTSFTAYYTGDDAANYETVSVSVSVTRIPCAHEWGLGVVTKEPTCETAGVRTYTCPVCDETKTEEIAALGHALTKTEAVAATCTETGNSAYWTCERCGKFFSDSEGDHEIEKDSWIVNAKGHSWDEGVVTKEATCTEAGVKIYTCTVCGETKTEDIAALGHDLKKTDAKDATCTEDGNSAYWTCERCNKYFLDSEGTEEIDADSWIIPASDHSWDEGTITKEATCTEPGVMTFTCTKCDETRTEVIAALGHNLKKTDAKDATCTEDGNSAYWKCERCSKYFFDADGNDEIEKNSWIVKAKGHTWNNGIVTKEPTDSEDGEMTYTCTVCGETKTETILAIGHELKKVEANAATCTKEGNSAYWVCKSCGKYYSDAEGKYEIKENEWIIPAAGHSWNDGEVTKEATCTEPGVKTFTCTVCGETKTEDIAASGHDLKKTDAKDATCTEEGNSAYWTCERCSKYFSDAEGTAEIADGSWIIKAKGHSWDEGTVTKAPTSTQNGEMTYTCTVCGATRTEAIPNKTHMDIGEETEFGPVTAESKALEDKLGIDSATAVAVLLEAEASGIREETLLVTGDSLAAQTKDTDLPGTTFEPLRLFSKKQTKSAITLKWTKVSGADGYLIYGNKCGNANRRVFLNDVTGTSWTQKKLKKGTFHKYNVVAYKVVNGYNMTLAASSTIHTVTTGGKFHDSKAVKVAKVGKKKGTKAALKAGKTGRIFASEVKGTGKLKKHRGLCYTTTDTGVATVSKKGIIKAVGAGKCKVWVYAQNGRAKAVTVTVQ